MFYTLRKYAISQWWIDRISALYDQATASVQINGTLAGPIFIQTGIIQGCPLNMVLYALFLHPLIRWLDVKLLGLQIGRSKQLEPVLAYADDVAVSVSYPAIGQ